MMSKRVLSVTLAVCVAIVVVASLILAACAPTQAPAPTQPTQPAYTPGPTKTAPTTTAPASPSPTQTAAPAPEAEVFEWRYADIYARESAYSLAAEAFVREVEEMSNGAIDITYYATGELMASGEIFDGITQRMVEMGPAGMGYATGAIGRVQHLDCGGAGYLSPWDAYGMLYNENGEFSDIYKLTQKYYGEVGAMPMPSFYGEGVDWCYSTKEVASANDLIGLKFRTSGMTSEILTKLGAATVWLPWEELYTGLQMGTVEAAEWGSPDLMYGMGLQEVAKHWYLPGMWTGYTESRLINLEAWNELPTYLQEAIEQASQSLWPLVQATTTKRDSIALAKAAEEGVEIHHWTEEDLDLFKSAWKEVMVEIGNSGEPYTAELFELIKEYRMSINQWPE